MVSGVMGSLVATSHAKALQVDEAAVLLDQDDGARQLSCCSLVVEKLGNELKLSRCWRGRISRASCAVSRRAIHH